MHFKLRYKMYTTPVGLNSFRNYCTGCSIILAKNPDDLRYYYGRNFKNIPIHLTIYVYQSFETEHDLTLSILYDKYPT